VPERVDELFGEYAAAYARGERPAASEFLARAGGEADELAGLIDRFLGRAPAPTPDDAAVAVFEAWQAGESPLPRLRAARGVTREAVVSVLVKTLGLDVKKKAKVSRYYHDLESGKLEPERVDRRVWEVLARSLGVRVADLMGRRPPLIEFGSAKLLRAPMAMASMAAPTAADTQAETEGDEVDRLFGNAGIS
jgi:hypothetical protein